MKKRAAAATPEPAYEYDERGEMIRRIIKRYFACQAANADFAEKLTQASGYGAAHEMEWSGGIFKAAATAKVCQAVITAVWNAEAKGAPLTLEAIYEHARREALRGATHPSKSTSTAANLMHLEETSAWASLAQGDV